MFEIFFLNFCFSIPFVPKIEMIEMVTYKRVQGTLDQFEFKSLVPIKNLYLDSPDENIRYRFMNWKFTDDRRGVLVYDNATDVPFYEVVVETTDGLKHKIFIENFNRVHFE